MTPTESAQLVFIQIFFFFLHFFLKLLFAFLFFLQNTGLGWRSVTPACPQPSSCLPHCPHNSWPAGFVQDKSNNTFKCTVVDFKVCERVCRLTAAVQRRCLWLPEALPRLRAEFQPAAACSLVTFVPCAAARLVHMLHCWLCCLYRCCQKRRATSGVKTYAVKQMNAFTETH